MVSEEERRSSEPRREEDLWAHWERRLKDLAMFVFGAAGFFHEMLFRPEPEIALLVASCGLMGVPLVMAADTLRMGKQKEETRQ